MIWAPGEYVIICLVVLSIVADIFVFIIAKVYRIRTSSLIMLAMTLILLIRALSSVAKLTDGG